MLTFGLNYLFLQAITLIMCMLLTHSHKKLKENDIRNIAEDDKSESGTCDTSLFIMEKTATVPVIGSCVFKPSLKNLLQSKSCYQVSRTQKFKMNYIVKEYFWNFKSYRNQRLIVLNIRHKFSNLSKNLPIQEAVFKISPLLWSYLTSNVLSLIIQFATTIDTDASWTVHSLVNQLVSLTITRNGENLRMLPHPVDIFFKYKPKTNLKLTQGFISKTLFRDLTDNKDDLVTVYKLDSLNSTESVMIIIRFYHIKTNEEFKVLLTRNIWPDYNTMTSHPSTISRDKSSYKVKLENQAEEDNYFLGILPNTVGTQLTVGQISYSFEVRYFQCLLKHGDKWTSQGCNVGDETAEEMLHCQCHHLSLFGGHAAISPRELDLLSDIHLILDIKDNPRTTLLVSSLILVYLIVLVWTRHSDHKDQLQRNVVVLADNFPGETWPYLVTVFTGFWIGAGTDANVALRLYGTKGMSRVHILQSRERKVLKQNCDDWFLIFTPKSLGEIEKIHLFHDHSGRSHDWYCSKIIIYDLKDELNYKFVIEKWLSLKETDECVELYAHPTSTLKYLKRSRMIQENIIFGLRETHLLLSIFTRHPRSSVTRSQRLSICLCIVIVHLLTSIMFYQIGETTVGTEYSARKRPIIISMESTFLAAPFTFIVIFCFKKSRIMMPRRGENVPMTLTAKMPVPLESGLQVNQSSTQRHCVSASSDTDHSLTASATSLGSEEQEETDEERQEESCWSGFYQQIQRLLFQVLLVKPMMPVRIGEEDDQASQVRKKWICAAWLLCTTAIFAGGIFILLYNLKMDFETSNEWMHTSFRYSLANIFFMSPVKIIIFAVILAMLYGQLQYIPSYECDTDAALNRESVGNEKFLSKISKIRRGNCYRPLNMRENMVIRMRKSNWRRWRIVINFTVVILLYAVLTLEVLFHWEGLYVPTTNHILQMFGEGSNITSLLSYYEYLTTVAFPALNKKNWFNRQPTMPHDIWKQETGFTKDYLTRLMSRPFLRQQRAAQDSCRVLPIMSDRFSHCYAPLPWFSKGDEEEFSANWTQSQVPAGNIDSPWVFSDSDSPLLICGLETGKCYLPGGYISRLDYNLTTTESTLGYLQQSAWLDEATRVVFLEMVMYNANTDLMSYVTPMMEKLADGSLQFHVKTTNLHSRPINYTARLTIIMSFTFYYLCRIVLLFNRQGLDYLCSSIGLLDIFLNVLLHVTMISMTLYNEARKAYIYEWYESNQEDLIMTKDIFVHRAVLRYETAILVIIIPAQLLHNFQFGKRNLIVFKTLAVYLKFTLGFCFAWAVFYLAFMQICIINGRNLEFFTLNHVFGWLSYGSFSRPTFPLFSTVFHFVTNFVAIFTIIISVKCYKEAKEYYKYDCCFNMFCFLCEKLKRAKMKTSEFKIRLGKCFELRTRAGADCIDCLPTNRTCSQVRQMCSDLPFKCDVVLEKLREIEKTFQ